MTAIARQGETEPIAPSAPRAEVLRGLRGALPLMLSLVPIGLEQLKVMMTEERCP